MDIGVVAAEIAVMRKKLASWMKPQRASTPLSIQPAKSFIVREPSCAVLIIAPWNYPIQLRDRAAGRRDRGGQRRGGEAVRDDAAHLRARWRS